MKHRHLALAISVIAALVAVGVILAL